MNWDEFYFLSHVHTFLRQELTAIFQMAHVHLFRWLPTVMEDEMTQIVAARSVMMVLFLATVVLIAKLASRWSSSSAAWIAPLCYLAASPVLRHGSSFRADSLLAPLTVGVLILLTRQRPSRSDTIFAGVLLGAALAVTVKAVLIFPLLVMTVLLDRAGSESSVRARLVTAGERLLLLGSVAAASAGVLLTLHAATLPDAPDQTVQDFATNAARSTLLVTPFFPRWDYFRLTLDADWVTWLLISAGAVAAVARRSAAAVCALSLLPLLFYRNSFPYYYVVMLAPAAVLAAVGVDALRSLAVRGPSGGQGTWIPFAVSIPLALQAGLNLYELRHDDQAHQRQLISAVHEILPRPVNYIDHSGMIASFRKVNFFMSTWGLETYRDRGSSFMRETITRDRAPLLLVNQSVLDPASPRFLELLPEDRRLIEQYYLPYWGPIRVAGAETELLSPGGTVRLSVPFSGRYRLEADGPVLINGELRDDGAIVDIPESANPSPVTVTAIAPGATTARLLWAEAQPPPSTTWPPFARIYTGL
ncbi:MAG TPA: hypothetical protein VMR74_15670 [Gammaproteobacteria bacterium]|nr:hypothetical protein [Gammaproteobacteria bacterium]